MIYAELIWAQFEFRAERKFVFLYRFYEKTFPYFLGRYFDFMWASGEFFQRNQLHSVVTHIVPRHGYRFMKIYIRTSTKSGNRIQVEFHKCQLHGYKKRFSGKYLSKVYKFAVSVSSGIFISNFFNGSYVSEREIMW